MASNDQNAINKITSENTTTNNENNSKDIETKPVMIERIVNIKGSIKTSEGVPLMSQVMIICTKKGTSHHDLQSGKGVRSMTGATTDQEGEFSKIIRYSVLSNEVDMLLLAPMLGKVSKEHPITYQLIPREFTIDQKETSIESNFTGLLPATIIIEILPEEVKYIDYRLQLTDYTIGGKPLDGYGGGRSLPSRLGEIKVPATPGTKLQLELKSTGFKDNIIEIEPLKEEETRYVKAVMAQDHTTEKYSVFNINFYPVNMKFTCAIIIDSTNEVASDFVYSGNKGITSLKLPSEKELILVFTPEDGEYEFQTVDIGKLAPDEEKTINLHFTGNKLKRKITITCKDENGIPLKDMYMAYIRSGNASFEFKITTDKEGRVIIPIEQHTASIVFQAGGDGYEPIVGTFNIPENDIMEFKFKEGANPFMLKLEPESTETEEK